MKATKTEAVLKVGNRIQDVRLETPKLSDVAERLQLFMDEIDNISESIGETFNDEISKKARLRLEQAIHEIKKLKNGVV